MKTALKVWFAPGAAFVRAAHLSGEDSEHMTRLPVNMLVWNTVIVLAATLLIVRV